MVFSIGCIAFNLLNGKAAFKFRDDVINYNGSIESLTGRQSTGCVAEDFIEMCLCPEPFKRASIPELTQHLFLQ